MNILQLVLITLVTQLPQRPASIDGTVVKLGTGDALPNATVQLNLIGPDATGPDIRPRDAFHRTAKSDANGRFSFENVAPGEYQLIATHNAGYTPAEYGQRFPTGQGIKFELTAGQRMTGIQLAMSPTGSISGRVYDRDGEPLGKAQVQALRPIYKDGRRTMTIVQTVQTDDHGEYRLFWLAPGRYYVSAKPDIIVFQMNPGIPNSATSATVRITSAARFGTYEQGSNPVIRKRRLRTGEVVEETYVPTYYPGTIEMQAATPIDVRAGATIGGVDMPVAAGLQPARHIRGTVINTATGQPAGQASLVAIPRVGGPHLTIPSAQSNPDGSFDIPGVVPGAYQIFATSQQMTGIAPVEIADKDLLNVPISLISSFNISGRFVFDGLVGQRDNPQRSLPRIDRFIRDPEILGMPPGGPAFNPPPAADGSFRADGVSPGDFRVTIRGLPPDSYVKSIRMGNADVLNDGLHLYSAPESPLEIVIGTNAGKIEGSVVNARQQPLANRTVVLVPDIRFRSRADLYRVVSTDAAGRFRMQGLPPGDYKLFAWEEVETGAWQDPDFIRVYENRGRAMQISEGTNGNLQLTVIP
jgi:protocatechuate 3,4-dioxygenase beta subunit